MSNEKNPFGSNKGFDSAKPASEVIDFHRRDDVDSADTAHHHTLGYNAGQAASGAALKALVAAGAFGRVGDFQFNDTATETSIWKLANGQILLIADYPDAFALYGTAHGGNGTTTFGIPNLKERFIGAKDAAGLFMNTIAQTGGVFANKLDHTHTTASHTHTGPSHTHTGPSHTHTGPSHTHSISLAGLHSHTISSEANHSHTISGQTADPTPTANGTGGTNVPRHSHYSGHAHGGSTGNAGSHDHGASSGATGTHDHGAATGSDGTGATGSSGTGATGADGTGATGGTAPSTNGHTFGNPTMAILGNDWFDNRPPVYVSNIFVRVALGI